MLDAEWLIQFSFLDKFVPILLNFKDTELEEQGHSSKQNS